MHSSSVFLVNFKQISHIYGYLLTKFTHCFSVFTVNLDNILETLF